MTATALLFSGLLTLSSGSATLPQDPPRQTPPVAEDEMDAYDLGELTVSSTARRGGVIGDIEPEISLSEEDLKLYGAGNIGELLTALAPLTQSSRGRGDGQPVTLINGRRISSFREISGIPGEAIERVDILPEEVALSYGYRADQRVVNFVLKSSFRALTVQADLRVPSQGGRTALRSENNLFRIDGGQRYSLDINYQRDTALFETDRNITREADGRPFSLAGTVTGLTPDAEIDPQLSALAGSLVTIARAPGSAANGAPTIQDFVAGAGIGASDLTAYRTLSPEREQATLRGSIKRDLNDTTSLTVSASLEDTESLSYLGLPGVVLNLPGANPYSPFGGDTLLYRSFDRPDALTRSTDTLAGTAGVVVDGFIADWRWTFTGNYERTETETTTGRGVDGSALQTALTTGDPAVNPFGDLSASLLPDLAADTARSVSSLASAELVLAGTPKEIPAGAINSTITFGFDSRKLESESVRSGIATDRSLSRDRGSVQGSFTVPIASRDREILGALGDLSLNLNLGYEELSDFGGLSTIGGVANWSPIEPLSLLFSYTAEEGAPTVQQLNDPVVQTPNVPIYDFATGQTVNIVRTEGGNPNLSADDRQVFKLGATLRPFTQRDLTISTTWTRSELRDQIATFPTITPALEQALPERFTRDTDGNLTSIDVRPLNYELAERQDLRTGFNFSRAFGRPTAPAPGARQGPGGRPGGGGPGAGGPPPGGGRMAFGGPGGGGARGRGRGAQTLPGQGRFNVSVYHTWRIQDEITIRDGLPVLDLLDGQSVSGRGGQPRHEIQAQGGVFRNGMGGFLNATWRDSTRVDGGLTGEDLFFSDQTTINLNMFVDLSSRESWVERYPVLTGARINLGVENLFDSRLKVTDARGETPLGYQPDYLDPQGRTIRISLRKLF